MFFDVTFDRRATSRAASSAAPVRARKDSKGNLESIQIEPGGLGMVMKTIDTTAIGQGVLKGKGAIGQRVSDQIFQLNLAKTAARLLVRQNILQLRNLARQLERCGCSPRL